MKIVTGDIWDYPADILCITTNGTVKKNGEAVMGPGVALQATQRYSEIAALLGAALQKDGNRLYFFNNRLVTFPVKHHWKEKADLVLIRSSATCLGFHAAAHSSTTYVLPRPGCGNGGLDWKDVRPILEPLLPDNVHVIDKETG